MPIDQRWTSLHTLKGWTVSKEYELIIEKAHLKQHPQHWSYIPASKVRSLTETEAEIYDHLNEKLHDELRRVSKEHFASTPVPPELQKDSEPYLTPFTYQNYDWYGPSYECYIVVIAEYISADLLRKFQMLLEGDHQDWCIQVISSETPDFDNGHEIAIFSDLIVVPSAAAESMDIPQN
ncbi:MAG: hypothetical protein COA78_16145 [Blastopirellula sp.]|nr:MAG: hypothetical protein COA78_16145 [Blastopirellula sp.]